MKAINLKTEFLRNPIGIDIQKPRLMWNCEGGKKETAFRIVAFSDGAVLYDSGKVISSDMCVEYPCPLESRKRIDWNVTLYDENDKEGKASNAFFETGLLNKEDFMAEWISGDYKPKKNHRYPVDCFRKSFHASQVKKARLYISACGLYEARLNGKRVGEFIFAPGSTDYHKRIQYQTYDVSDLIDEGNNELTIELADGWYRGSNGAKGKVDTYGRETKLYAQLEMTDENGNRDVIYSDGSWSWSQDGPILFADLKDGEKVDANKKPSYQDHAKEVSFHGNLVASNNIQVKEKERFLPVNRIDLCDGKTVLAFPQNLSGYISFKVHAHKGNHIHIVLGEMLDEKGEVTLKNVQCVSKGKKSPLQEIDYICKEGLNEYSPKFFYGGFRYAQIETNVPFKKDDFEAVAVYSDFEETSYFECSNPLMNKLYQNTLWSLKSNSTDLPSDCPTRERMGWTGDSQIFFNTASYLVDYAAFARKHVKDIYDRQWRSGKLPQIAPYANEDWFLKTMNGSVGWACAGVYIPYYFYRRYGDRRILEENYEGMLRYARFMMKRAGRWGGVYARPLHLSFKNRKYAVNCGQSYGEWAEPFDVVRLKWYDFVTPHPEESTAYTYFTLEHVLKIAEILKKKKDKTLLKIEEYARGAKRAYQELVTKKKYSLDTDRQAKLVRPLYMGLLDKEQEDFAKKRLIQAMDDYGWRVGTGFLSTPFILYVLADLDIQYAYRLLENEKCPGWLFMPKNDATTIWEDWEGETKGVSSLNHYSKGAVVEWMIGQMCGIEMGNRENTFLIKPRPGGTLSYAKAGYRSIYGLVESGWEIKEGIIKYHIVIPSNCEADVVLPDKTARRLPAGEYEF